MPVLFLTSKHQGNILGMTQVKVAAETRTRERVFRVVKQRIRRLGTFDTKLLPSATGPGPSEAGKHAGPLIPLTQWS